MTLVPPRLRRRIAALVEASDMKGAASRELRDDLYDHVKDALDQGVDPLEIERRLGTVDDLGPVLRESPSPSRSRPDAEGEVAFWEGLGADVRHGIRSLGKIPTLAGTVILVLGLAIAANAVVFTAVNELLLRPLPVDDQAALVDVWADVEGGNSFAGFGWRDVEAYQEVGGPLDDLAAFAGTRLGLGEGLAARSVVAHLVSGEYLPMLGIGAQRGTLDMGFDDGLGAEPRVVLSHQLWTDRFGADPEVVGTTVVLDGQAATVVGIAEDGFRGHFIGFPVDLWLPLGAAPWFLPGFDADDRSNKPFEMLGRLEEGATPEAARAALGAVARRLEAEYPETHRGHGVGVTPTTGLDHSLRGPVTAFVAILTGVGTLVLLIASLNVGSVLLVRTMSREREMAVRLALGAGRWRLVRQTLVEACVLAALGTALGVSLALILNGFFADLFHTLSAGLGLELELDRRVLAMTSLAGVGAALVAGATPALHVLRRAPVSVLRGRGEDPRAGWVRGALVVGQVTASFVLLVATGLFVRAFTEGARADPGFAAEEVATIALQPGAMGLESAGAPSPGSASADLEDVAGLAAMLDEIRGVPGVDAVSVADGPPVGFSRSPLRVGVPGVEPPPDRDAWTVDARRVGGGYLETVGIELRAGRGINDVDAGQRPPVAVVSEAFVERFWPGESAVGRSITVGDEPVRVVGVARDSRYLAQDDVPDPFLYLSLAGALPSVPVVTLRASEPERLLADVQRVVSVWAPDRPPPGIRSARTVLDTALLPQRLGAGIVGGLGLAALLLAVVGLYGLVQYSVASQTPELAVRLALGGSGREVVKVALRKGFLLVLIGTVLGAGVALAVSPTLSTFLGPVSPRDPAVFAGVVATFAAVALLASWGPARKAARIDPARVLRSG